MNKEIANNGAKESYICSFDSGWDDEHKYMGFVGLSYICGAGRLFFFGELPVDRILLEMCVLKEQVLSSVKANVGGLSHVAQFENE